MKKKLVSIAIIVSVLAIAAMGTLAYFTDTDTAHNEITMGNVGIVLHEGDGEGNPFENPVGVMPGDEIAKVVTIENDGANAVWVRIFVNLVLTDAEGAEMELPEELITVAFNNEDWLFDEETGAWYFDAVLEPGETTAPVITNVQFDIEMGNEYMNAMLAIDVYAQAVQAANNGETVLEAAGWPAAD